MIEHKEILINQIHLLEENPRDIDDNNLEKLREDIQKDPEFLFQRPPLINLSDGNFICYAGTQRVKAASLNGNETIMCFVEKDVPYKVQKERMLKDNLHRGKWDKEKLIDLDFTDFELENFGFDDISIGVFSEGQETDLEYPKELTAEKKDAPPSIKITFKNSKQLSIFEKHLEMMQITNEFEGITYSVSQGEL